jgi:tetratricopeptide (TPR) repeat protein
MTETLEELLSLFLKREETAPGVWRVSLAVGEHLVGVEVRAPEGALFLRALPLEALPDALARRPEVRERITHFGDIVKSGRLGRDDAGRPILEVDLAGLDGSRETYFGVLEAVAVDCARLRGAAEGFVAGLEMAQAQAARAAAPAPVPSPRAPLDAPGPSRTRLWESVLQQQLPPSLQKLAQDRREQLVQSSKIAPLAEVPAAPAAAAAAAAQPPPPPPAPAAPAAPPSPAAAAEEPPSTWEDLERELLGSNPENPPAATATAPAAPAAAGAPPGFASGPSASVPAPPRPAVHLPAHGVESSQIFASLGGEPSELDDFFAGARPAPAEEPNPFVEGFLEELPSSPAFGARREGSAAPAPPPPAGTPPPPKRATLFSRPTPPPPARKEAPEAEKEKEGEEPARPRKVGFFGAPLPGAPAEAPPGGEPAPAAAPGVKGRRSLFQPPAGRKEREREKAERPAELADPFAEAAPAAPPAPAAAKPPQRPAAPARPGPGHVPERLPGGSGAGKGGADATVRAPEAEKKPTKAAESQKLAGNVLDWMDAVEGGAEGAAFDESAVEEPARKRTPSFVIPKTLLVRVKDAARDWYRRYDREGWSLEVKKGAEALHLSTGEPPGESSWRFRKPTLRISRPPFEAGSFTYVPEPSELALEDVEAWLLSEQSLRDEDVTGAHRAQELFERAWALRAEDKLGEAEAALREVLELQPDNVLAITALGHLHRKELGKPEEALKLYGKALEKAPKFAPALLGRAALQIESDRHKAYEEAMAALALAPRDADILELAGIISLRANRKARARELFLRLYRVSRERGEAALDLVDAERAGEAKWDPMLVFWEKKALQKGGLDGVVEALYQERIAAAKRYEDLLREYRDLAPEQRRGRVNQLAEAPSYTFLYDIVPLYAEETDERARGAVEALFKSAPAQASMALEDSVLSGDYDRVVAAFRLVTICGIHELVKPALEAFRRMTLGRHVRAFGQELVKISGADAALALLAKLERGERDCLGFLSELLARRPDERAEEAATAVHAALQAKAPGVDIPAEDREPLLRASEPSAEEIAERSSAISKKEARLKRLKELEEELTGGGSGKKKKKEGEEGEA